MMYPRLLHELSTKTSLSHLNRTAIVHGKETNSYKELNKSSLQLAYSLLNVGFQKGDRLAIYLPKSIKNVVTILATSMAGGIFVPINPILKASQVKHIMTDSGARVLVTSSSRLKGLRKILSECPDLNLVIVIDERAEKVPTDSFTVESWVFSESSSEGNLPRLIDSDVSGILYTSGSTGKPKGVILSHRNIVAGAQSVAEYINNNIDDRILSLLPLSFDAGFSQLTTALLAKSRLILLDYLVPMDVVRACEKHGITGITGVPPLWMQLARLNWTAKAREGFRYFANTGGKMPRQTLSELRRLFPNAKPFLMYGLTEAFRSTYLSPEEVDRKPDSIGKAIPNVEIMVINDDGELCKPDEPGELVHRGPLVSMGYWRDKERTLQRFKPLPTTLGSTLPLGEVAVWSGDTVRMDDEGFLYFIGRKDGMIKTSGYRVSPTEVEEIAFSYPGVAEAVAVGIPHLELGQVIGLAVVWNNDNTANSELLKFFRKNLPAYMIPAHIESVKKLARNANGKIDRDLVRKKLSDQMNNEVSQ